MLMVLTFAPNNNNKTIHYNHILAFSHPSLPSAFWLSSPVCYEIYYFKEPSK